MADKATVQKTTALVEDPLLNDKIVSMIRVGAAAVAGYGCTELLRLGVNLDSAQAASLVTMGFTSAYYTLVRVLESKFSKAGWFLLVKRSLGFVENS